MARQYGTAHERANQWLLDQWYSQWQLNDAYDKIRQKQSSWMSNTDIISDIRQNRSNYIDSPMYGSSSSDDYDWGGGDEYVPTWEELHPAVNRNVWWKDFSFQSHEDWSITLTTWNLNKTYNKGDKNYDFVNNYLNWISSKQTSTNPNATNAESGLWDQAVSARDSKAFDNYDNAYQYYKSQWMSNEDASKKAQYWLDNNTMSKSKKDKEAEINTNTSNDTDEDTWIANPVDTNEDIFGWMFDETNEWEDDSVEWLNWFDANDAITSDWLDAIDSITESVNNLTSNNTETNVVENKAKVSKDPIFDYQTYFRENLSWPENVWKTGQVKNKIEQGPLTNVRGYQDETTQALQNLWFLQPDTEAANNMPDTVEQEDVKSFENPEQLMTDFDSKLTEMQNTNWIAPQAVAQAYVDYRNQLAKYIRENNIPDDEAAAMFDQLKKNEKLNELLTQSKK